MKDAREFEASDLKEAVRIAAQELQIEVEALEYEILDSGAKGFLGVGTRPARIVVSFGRNEDVAVEMHPADQEISDFLTAALEKMEIDLAVHIARSDEYLHLTMEGRDKDVILQNRAELLEALQYLLNRIFGKKLEGLRIIADCDGFRKRKEEELRQIAKRISEKVKLSGEKQMLGFMNPYERRIVHLAVAEEEGVCSESAGDGFMKRIVILPA
jgi:spoIIIJ-associated protein